MFFWFKRGTVVVDAFTHSLPAYKYFPVETANKFVPEWWKQTPKHFDCPIDDGAITVKGNTARRCAGIIDYYHKNSIIVPLWSDLELDYGPQGYAYAFADSKTALAYHPQVMRGEYMKEYEHYKIASAWKFREKTGVKFHFSSPFYNYDDPGLMVVPPAIVNYKYQHSTEFNFMLKRPAVTKRFSLQAGQPLIHLAPLTDKNVVVKTHMVTPEEYERSFRWVFAFNNLYNKAKKISDARESKCPFGFGK